jgi:FSR family fosmidomycin resistance protein-like MFS transporter
LFGLLADRTRAPLLALGGVLWQALFIGLSGLSGRFELLLGLIAVGGLGSAAFHPPGAGGVPRVSPKEQRGGAMSVFLLGGTSGYAFGPLVAGWLLNAFGPQASLGLSGLALVTSPLLVVSLRALRYEQAPQDSAEESTREDTGAVSRPALLGVLLLAGVVAFRQSASLTTFTYLPQLFLERNLTVAFAGNISFALMLGSVVGSLSAGFLSDRLGRYGVIAVSLMAATPLLAAVPRTEGWWLVGSVFLLGIATYASLPLTLLIGQELVPDRPGLMSSLTLGFTFIAAGIGTAIAGRFAESASLTAMFSWLPLLPLAASLAALGLAAVHRGQVRGRATGPAPTL